MDHGEVNMSSDRGLQNEGEDLSEPVVLTTCSLPSSSTISPTLDDNHLVAPSSLSATATDLRSGGSDLLPNHSGNTSSSCLTPLRSLPAQNLSEASAEPKDLDWNTFLSTGTCIPVVSSFFSSPRSACPRFSPPGVKPPFQAASCRSVVVRVAEFVTFDAVFERTAESAGIRNSNPREADFILCKYHHSASIVSDERDVRGFQACLDAHKRGKSWAVVASVGSPMWSLCFNSETDGICFRVLSDLCVFGSVLEQLCNC